MPGMDLGELSFRISVSADGIQAAMNEAGASIQRFIEDQVRAGDGAADMGDAVARGAGEATEALDAMGASAQNAQAASAAGFAAISAAAVKAFFAVRQAISGGVEAYNTYVSAMKGLRSVATFKGIDTGKLKNALAQLEDQFLDTASASAALKNLLSRGYSLNQAIETINRLKDAAAYGRQASYDMAEAVVSATEGLKNENSILVDNAGVTKNVAKMWEEYAKARGITTAAMTQEMKVEAEYLGIMRETEAQVGNAAEAANTLAGAQATSAKTVREVATAFGSAMAPAIQLANEVLSALLGVLRDMAQTAPGLSSGLAATVLAFSGMMAAAKAAQAISALGAAMKAAAGGVTIFGHAINLSMPWLAGIAALLGVGVAAYTAFKKSAEAAAEAQEKARQQREEEKRQLDDIASSMDALSQEYRTLSQKENQSYRDKVRMHEIEKEVGEYQETLASRYGLVIQPLSKNAEGHGKNADEMEREAKAAAELARRMANEDALAEANKAYADASKEIQKWAEAVEETQEVLEGIRANQQIFGESGRLEAEARQYGRELEQYTAELEKAVTTAIPAFVEKTVHELESGGVVISDAEKSFLQTIAMDMANGHTLDFSEYESEIADSIMALATSETVQAAIDKLTIIGGKVANGVALSNNNISTIKGAYDTLVRELSGDIDMSADVLDQAIQGVFDALFGEGVIMATEDGIAALDDFVQEYNQSIKLIKAQSNQELTDVDAPLENIVEAFEQNTAKLISAAESAASAFKNATDDMASIDALVAELGQYSGYEAAMQNNAQAVELLSDTLEMAVGSQEEFDAAMSEAVARTNEIAGVQAQAMGDLASAIEILRQQMEDIDVQMQSLGEGDAEAYVQLEEQYIATETALRRLENTMAMYPAYANQMAAASVKAKNSTKAESKEWKAYKLSLEDAEKYMSGLISAKKQLDDALSQVQAIQAAGGSFEEVGAILAALPMELRPAGDSFEQVTEALQKGADNMQSVIDSAISDVQNQIAALQAQYAQMQVSGSLNASTDTSGIQAEIARLQQLLALYQSLVAQSGGTARFGRGGGGGGGGKKETAYQKAVKKMDDQVALDQLTLRQQLDRLLQIQRTYRKLSAEDAQDLAERLHNIREQVRKEAFDNDMALYNHQKAMGQLTVRQEISALETIKRAHKLTKEEMWDLDERLYNLRKQLTQEEQDALTAQTDKAKTVYQQLVDALRERYNKERNLRKAALNEQIRALQDEQAAEDEARQKQQYEEELAEKQRLLRVEKSARRRREIEKEISDLILQEEQRLADAQRQAQIDRLTAQIDAIDEQYDKLTDESNLNMEAAALALSGNMDAMAAIIGEYTPQFKNAGEDLMAYLTEGITSQKTSLLSILTSVFDDAAAQAMARIESLGGAASVLGYNPVTVYFSIDNVNEASDFETVQQKLADMVRSATRGS